MSTVAGAIWLALLAVAGCAGGGGPSADPGAHLTLAPLERLVFLQENEKRDVGFRLSSGGVPIGGRLVMFKWDSGNPNGARLDDFATTDSQGVATTTVIAGGYTSGIDLRAFIEEAAAKAEVFVNDGPAGDVDVTPFFLPTSESQPLVTEIEVQFHERHRCADFVLAMAHAEQRKEGLTAAGQTAHYQFISTKGSHAVIGIAWTEGRGRVVATGCVDMPGNAVVPGGLVQLALPLADVVPDPVGTYAVTTRLGFSPPLADAAPIAAAYRDLTDCPFDPGELLLDCTMDALSPATVDDPLDCIPAADEGTVAAKLASHRGVPIVDGAGVPTGCRGARDAAGRVSFDAVVLGLYGSPKPPVLIDLPAIANDATHLFDHMTLSSTLELQPEGAPATYTVRHTLASATFFDTPLDTPPPGEHPFSAAIDIPGLPVPVPTAFSLATTAEDELLLGEMGFTLRLGSLARAGFAAVALDKRGVTGGATGLMTTIAGLAHSEDGMYRGCAAIDHALCAQIDEAPGCLVTACGNGMTAFAARLDGGFDALDGTGLDLHLTGTATLHDSMGNGIAGRIGADDLMTGDGAWSLELRTRSERRTISASFEGVR